MKINFKKIATVLGSALMVGSTMGMAAAANFPAPFVQSGNADVAVVVGANAALSDAVAATNLGSNLASALAAQTATGSTAGTTTATGGDSYNLGSGSSKIYYNTAINTNKATLTKSELPTLLADDKVIDDTGSEYTYSQQVVVGSKAIAFGTSGGDLDDPALHIEVGDPTAITDAANLYKIKVNFNKEINVSSTDVQGNTVKVLGRSFTIGTGSTNTSLVLFGTGLDKTVKEGETANVTVGGKAYTIVVSAVTQTSSTNYVSLSVNGGETRKVAEGSSVKVGDLNIYAKTVTYSAKESTTNYADLSIGSETVTLTNGQTVKLGSGSDQTSVQGTMANLTATGSGKINGFTVSVGMQKTTKDYIKAGESFTDPVFGGLKLQFAAMNPTFDATSRDTMVVDTDNAKNARITFTSALASEDYLLTFAHDDSSVSGTVRPLLATSANKTIHVVEGETIGLNQLMLINNDDRGCIVRLDDISITGTNDYVEFRDVITDDPYKVSLNTAGQADASICGASYKVANASATTATIRWGAGSTYTSNGDVTTISPRIKLKNGQWFTVLSSTSLTNGTTYSLPGTELLSTYQAGSAWNFGTVAANATAEVKSKVFGNVNYTASVVGTTDGVFTSITLNGLASPACNFNSTLGPAILIVEEKKSTDTNGDAICIPLTTTGSTAELAIGTPTATGVWSGLTTLTSDTYKSQAVTKYGSFVERDTSSGTNNKVTIQYPDTEMIADVLFTSEAATITTDSGSSGTAKQLGQITVFDNEVSSVQAKNMVVIGGSCINTVAAKLLGSDTPVCSADFTTKTGIADGQYLIQVFASPYATDKVAVLVAGYNAADTTKAVTYLTTNTVSTAVGTKLKGTSATEATVETA